MAQTQPSSRARLETPPSRPAVLPRLHHQQGAQHHLDRMFSYTGRMKKESDEGQLPSMEHALQVSADLARFIGHLAALKEIEVAEARPQREKQAASAPVFKSAATRKTA